MLPPSGPQPLAVGVLPDFGFFCWSAGQLPSSATGVQVSPMAALADWGSIKLRPIRVMRLAAVACETTRQTAWAEVGAATARVKESSKLCFIGILLCNSLRL